MDLNFSNKKKQTICFIGITILCFIIQIFKAKYTLGRSDEHFYIALGNRLLQGDRLFFDEWHIAQMISVFTAPFVWLHQLLFGNNEGIVYFMRIMYALFQVVVGSVVYYRLKDKTNFMGLSTGIVLYYLFTPYNIMALSYNTMSVGFHLLACVCYPLEKEEMGWAFVSGLCFACAVLNTPYLALLYFIFLFYLVKTKQMKVKVFLAYSIGIACIALSFLLFVFTRISLNEFQIGLSHLIDPSHSEGIFGLLVVNGGRLILNYHISFIGLVALVLLPILFRKKKEALLPYLLLISFLIIIWITLIHPIQLNFGGYVLAFIPYALVGFGILVLTKQANLWKIIYVASILHALFISVSSNVGPRSFSSPLITACLVTTILLFEVDMKQTYRMTFVCIMIVILGYFKLFNHYNSSGQFDAKASSGPCKGLLDSQEVIHDYEEVLMDIKTMNQKEEEYVIFLSDESWPYLATNKKAGGNSTYIYFWFKDQYINCENDYHEVHPSKETLLYLDSINPYQMTKEDPYFSNMTFIEDMRHGILFKR